MAKHMIFPQSTFINRYFDVTCKLSHATDFVNDMHAITPKYHFITDKVHRNKTLMTLTFTIPSGTCYSELELIDNMIDFLFHVYSREEQRVTK